MFFLLLNGIGGRNCFLCGGFTNLVLVWARLLELCPYLVTLCFQPRGSSGADGALEGASPSKTVLVSGKYSAAA
eukprot:2869990-Amphidinium_carterae.1